MKLTDQDAMLGEFYPRDENGELYLPPPSPLPPFMTLAKSKHKGPWVLPVDLAARTGFEACRFSPITIPPEVQAQYDALPEERKAELRAEVDEAIDGLYAKFGITRGRNA